MATPPQVLIVGAGPAGLAAALFLSRRGVPVRVIDAGVEPTRTSKALGVNPRTLSLLEDTGVAACILAEAQEMRSLFLHHNGRPLTTIRPDWRALGATHPMVILPQARTEALLAEALVPFGVAAERGKALATVSRTADEVTAALADGETIRIPMLLAADGAHSTVRKALNLDFPGDGWDEPRQLMDVDIDGLQPDQGWIDLHDEGVLIALPFSGKTFRLIGFGRPLLEGLPPQWTPGTIHWKSDFHISHRMVERMTVGRICLAGDAAHIHSPIGARGMNLGIEDAFVFAACAADFLNGEAGRLEDYHRIRHPVDAAVVDRVRRLTSMVRNTSPLADWLKGVVPPLLSHLPFALNAGLRVGMGLDHPVTVR
jgi:2-polyprenyl-6-methoxyphenol hydroxylase-like FAD-dependent oxidoreductase